MPLTFLQMQNLVVENAMGRSDKLATIKTAINLAVQEIGKIHPWRALRVQSDYALATDDFSVEIEALDIIEARAIITDNESYPIKILRKDFFVRRWPNVEVTPISGRPLECYYENGVLFFAPRSGTDTYVLRVTRISLPDALIVDADTTLFDASMAIIAWASSYTLASIGMAELSPTWDQRYTASLANAVRAEKRGLGVTEERQEFGTDSQPSSSTPWLDPFRRTNYE